MHKSDSQFRIINNYLAQRIENPLAYKEVEYEKREWDNIPMVIPRFCIHLSKHVEALTYHYRQRCEEETTADLREALMDQIKSTMQTSNDIQVTLQGDVTDLRG